MNIRSRFSLFKKNQPSLQEVIKNTIRLLDTNTATLSLFFIHHHRAKEAKQLLDAWAKDPQGNHFSIETCTATMPTSYFITLTKKEYDVIMGEGAYAQRVAQVYRRF